jgi:hypothetical protein
MTNVDASRKNVAIRFILVLLGRAELTNKIVHMVIAAPEQAVLMKKRGEKLPARRSVVETVRKFGGNSESSRANHSIKIRAVVQTVMKL